MEIMVTEAHIEQLIQIESDVKYDKSPPAGEQPFIVKERASQILLSAPHGSRTFRNNRQEVWHEEDEYTAGMALLLSELCNVSVIANTWRSDNNDPNYHRNCEYKKRMKEIILKNGIRFVIDLHGAALNSQNLDSDQTVDLGYRSDRDEERSIDEIHLQKLEELFLVKNDSCDPANFVIGRNHLPARGTGSSEPITTFIYRLNQETRVQAVQIEMKPQIRVVKRFPSASLYLSCGDFAADQKCIMHSLQALVGFIFYLENFKEYADES